MATITGDHHSAEIVEEQYLPQARHHHSEEAVEE